MEIYSHQASTVSMSWTDSVMILNPMLTWVTANVHVIAIVIVIASSQRWFCGVSYEYDVPSGGAEVTAFLPNRHMRVRKAREGLYRQQQGKGKGYILGSSLSWMHIAHQPAVPGSTHHCPPDGLVGPLITSLPGLELSLFASAPSRCSKLVLLHNQVVLYQHVHR